MSALYEGLNGPSARPRPVPLRWCGTFAGQAPPVGPSVLALLLLGVIFSIPACAAGHEGTSAPHYDRGAPASGESWQASEVDLTGAYARLAGEIRRAANDMGWAILRIEVPGESHPGVTPPPGLVRAWALTLDNREVTILAGPATFFEPDDGPEALRSGDADAKRKEADPQEPDTLRAMVRIGFFGDPGQERRYIETLERRLADRPLPQRGGFFILPDLPWPSVLDLSRPGRQQSE